MKNLIIRISNEFGNQMFMYASSLSIAKKMNRTLLIDEESSYLSRKNISKFGLNNFKLNSKYASDKYKFLGTLGYFKRKFLKKIDKFKNNKSFYIEKKNKKKITYFQKELFNNNLSSDIFLEGHFETEKYFKDIKDIILKEFSFKYEENYKNSPFYNELIKPNSVAICLRQNRFSEGKRNISNKNSTLSHEFVKEQISYINKSIDYFKKKIISPKFYLWSNEIENINESLFSIKITKVVHNNQFIKNLDQRALNLFLLSKCSNHIVIPSSYNWWGAWMNNSKNKCILRPADNFFSNFKINNIDFWPFDWIEIKK